MGYVIVLDTDPVMDMALKQKEYEKCESICNDAKEVICFRKVRDQALYQINKDVRDFCRAANLVSKLPYEDEEKGQKIRREFNQIKCRLESRNSRIYDEVLLSREIEEFNNPESIADVITEIISYIAKFFSLIKIKFEEKVPLKKYVEKISEFIDECQREFRQKFGRLLKGIEYHDKIILALFLKLGVEEHDKCLYFLTSDSGIIGIKDCLSFLSAKYLKNELDIHIDWNIASPDDFDDN